MSIIINKGERSIDKAIDSKVSGNLVWTINVANTVAPKIIKNNPADTNTEFSIDLMKSDQLSVFLIKPKSIVQKAPIDAASFGLKIPEYIPPIVTKNIRRKSQGLNNDLKRSKMIKY